MIISKTPFRISFAGGGSDLSIYYKKNPGKVISTSINKYIYVVVKKQLGIVEYNYRINWSKVEFCHTISEIKHPIVREALKYFKINYPIEISTFADIPSNTGLGSSSAFAVGLVHCLLLLKKQKVTKEKIARIAAKIEIDLVKRNIGKQDHFSSAFGNFNIFQFNANENVKRIPLNLKKEYLKKLNDRLILFYMNTKRDSSVILKAQKKIVNSAIIHSMVTSVKEIQNILNNISKINDIGYILDNNWKLKKRLSKKVSNPTINKYYNKAKNCGALGGKVLGAGGGGFLLIYAHPKKHKNIILSLKSMKRINFTFENQGTHIIFNEDDNI